MSQISIILKRTFNRYRKECHFEWPINAVLHHNCCLHLPPYVCGIRFDIKLVHPNTRIWGGRAMVFNIIFSSIVGVSFIGGGNRSTRRKPQTFCKSLAYSITLCSIEYTFPWVGFELTTLVVIGTDCTGSCKSNNYHTIKSTTTPTRILICSITSIRLLFKPSNYMSFNSVI